jgi:HEAT repeat protein
MIGRFSRLRVSIRVAMMLVVVGVATAAGKWAWMAYFSPTHRWLRAIRDPDQGHVRWGIAGQALRGKDPAVSPELATAALIEALKDPNWNVRGDAAAVLGQGGSKAEPAIPALIAALRDREVEVRKGAAGSLGEIIAGGGQGREWVIPALIGALSDRAAWVRQTAALELGSIVKPGDREAGAVIAALQSRLVDPSAGVRVWACGSLTRLGRGRECIPVLIEALDESETTVRAIAVATLADAGTGAAEAISALEARRRDEDNPIIRKVAEKALTSLRGGAESRGP